MRWICGICAAVVAGGLAMVALARSGGSSKDEIEAFNNRYIEMHLKMDTQEIFDTWAEDGVDLMPGMEPMIGKKAIVAWVEKIVSQMQGYKVVKEEVEFHDLHVSGDCVSEWATEHQVVQPPGKEKIIESRGKMALVLHREKSGEWKIAQEMWNAAPQR